MAKEKRKEFIYCTALNEGQNVILSADVGYRKDFMLRAGEKGIIAKGTKAVICRASTNGDFCGIRLDDGMLIYNIPSRCLEGV